MTEKTDHEESKTRRLTLGVLACLPGLIGSLTVIRFWLSFIPGNPQGSQIMPYAESGRYGFICCVTLLVGIPLALFLGTRGGKTIRNVGIGCSFLPFPVGFVFFNVIVTVMEYRLI